MKNPVNLLRATLALGVVAGSSIGLSPTPAQALDTRCAIIQTATVGGFDWRRMSTARVCSASLTYGTSGAAQLAQHKVTINYSSRRTSNVEAMKATVHELSHHVEWRTTAAHRARLYRYLGVNDPSGNYFVFNDKYYYSGSLAAWKASPRERLAESVVNCAYGSPNHTGMALVPRAQCTAFLAEFRASLAAAR